MAFSQTYLLFHSSFYKSASPQGMKCVRVLCFSTLKAQPNLKENCEDNSFFSMTIFFMISHAHSAVGHRFFSSLSSRGAHIGVGSHSGYWSACSYNGRGHVWAALSEALTFDLSINSQESQGLKVKRVSCSPRTFLAQIHIFNWFIVRFTVSQACLSALVDAVLCYCLIVSSCLPAFVCCCWLTYDSFSSDLVVHLLNHLPSARLFLSVQCQM